MANVAAGARWPAWLWAVWVGATIVTAIAVGYNSWLLFTFGGACDNGAPTSSSVRELQATLAVGALFCAASCFLLAAFTGRWWWQAGVSAAVIAATPLFILLTHPTLASWADSGLCLF